MLLCDVVKIYAPKGVFIWRRASPIDRRHGGRKGYNCVQMGEGVKPFVTHGKCLLKTNNIIKLYYY
jgi:hypothetical protein